MNINSILSVVVLQSAIVLLAGCGGVYEPMDPPYTDIPPGPGIFSGEKGTIEIDLDR